MKRVNQGPPWRRHSGELVPHGAQFESTSREEQIFATYGWGSTFPVVGAAPAERPGTTATATPPRAQQPPGAPPAPPTQPQDNSAAQAKIAAAAAAALPAQWPLKTDPETYLSRYPDGQHADLARRILGQTSKAETG
jgi:hypothetical protein